MTQETWNDVDRYFTDLLAPHDAAMNDALNASAAAGLPPISVSPNQGKLLHLLARMHGARNILEFGTLGGYSTIWLARAVAAVEESGGDAVSTTAWRGRVVTLESNAAYAEIARANIARAGVAEVVDLRIGLAIETVPQLAAEKPVPFDLTFIDADKASTPEYFDWALMLSRPGSVIVVDNVVRDGEIIDAESTDASVHGMRRFFERVAAEPGLVASAIQTVGTKGYDGFAVVLVTREYSQRP